MTPPAPLPEHDFERFLRDQGCEGRRKGSEYAVYRRSDGKLISTYAVRHGNNRREVDSVYKRNFEKAIARLNEEEEATKDGNSEEQFKEDESYKNSEWYRNQKLLEDEFGP